MGEFQRNTSGFTADVEKYDENTVVKIYRDNVPDEAVEREILCTESVQGSGLSVPEYRGRLVYEGKRAILLEYIRGSSMMELLSTGEVGAEELARDFAGIHYKMHQCRADRLEKSKVRFERMLRNSEPFLGTDLTTRTLKLLEKLPEGDALCHNDFHPQNILYNPKGMYVIDWSDATSGNPLADVAKTTQAFDYGGNIPKAMQSSEKVQKFMALSGRLQQFTRAYEKEYADLSGMTLRDFVEVSMPWRVVASAARFDIEWDTNKPGLLKMFYDYFEEHPVQ